MTKVTSAAAVRERINLRWKAYERQAELARSRRGPVDALGTIAKGSALAAVVPLAAAGVAAGQCQGPTPVSTTDNFLLSVTGPSSSDFVDVSIGGQNARFLLYYYSTSSFYLYGLGNDPSMLFLASIANSLAIPISGGQVIPATPPGGQVWVNVGTFCANGTAGVWCSANTDYFGIKSNGATGFAQLQVTSISPTQVEFKLLERGFRNEAGDSIAGDCGSLTTLPVELVSFDGLLHNGDIHLQWETASELNNAGFDVERAEGSGVFRSIGFVNGFGTTTEAQSYRFVDDAATANVNYKYRLKQIDHDGTTSYSEVVELFTADASQVVLSEIYPNPVNGRRATLEINLADPKEVVVEVFDIRGAKVGEKVRQLNAGANTVGIRTADLAAGQHYARVQVGETVLYRSFVVVE